MINHERAKKSWKFIYILTKRFRSPISLTGFFFLSSKTCWDNLYSERASLTGCNFVFNSRVKFLGPIPKTSPMKNWVFRQKHKFLQMYLVLVSSNKTEQKQLIWCFFKQNSLALQSWFQGYFNSGSTINLHKSEDWLSSKLFSCNNSNKTPMLQRKNGENRIEIEDFLRKFTESLQDEEC